MSRLLIASTVSAFIEAFLLPYADHFRALGWTVDAMASGIGSSERCVAAFDNVWDIRWSRNPLNPLNLLSAPTHVRRIVFSNNYDIVHVHTPVAGLVCRHALRGLHVPVKVYTAHGFHFHENGSTLKNVVFFNLEKLAGRRWTDYLVVINRDDEAAARTHGLVHPNRLVYMPGIGIDTVQQYNPDSVRRCEIDDLKRSLHLTSDAEVLLMLAEFIPRKRHRDALNAFVRLGRPNAHLLLAGAGPTLAETVQAAKQLGISAGVQFLGKRRDVPSLLRTADALLLCSEQEGLPRSVLEAMSLGTPVIGSDIRGTRELLQNGAGYLYRLGNCHELARVITLALDDRVESLKRARIARERISQYDVRRVITMHEDLYARALQRTHLHPSAATQPATSLP